MYDFLKGASYGRKMTGGKSKARTQIRVKKTEKYETIKDPLKNGRRSEEMLVVWWRRRPSATRRSKQHESSSSASSFVSFDRDFSEYRHHSFFAPPLLGNLGLIYQTLAHLDLVA